MPREFGDYEILGELGRGGMGRVFRARQRSLDRVVALKVIATGGLTSVSSMDRFRTEAEAVASLNHPHIVSIYEVGEHDGWNFFSMPLVDGPTLAQMVAGKPLPFRRGAELMSTLARAIQHAHERGVLHRDLKPGNILLDHQGAPHITDFGLAKFTQRDSDLTVADIALGTPAYMPPEQAAGRLKEITVASDVYSLGAVLFEVLTGKPPFHGETPLAVARQALEQEPPAPSALNPTVPPDLAVICLKCLEKEPGRRYASAAELAADLERWLRHEPIDARATNVWERFRKWIRRKPALSASLLLAGLLFVIGVGGVVWQWRQAESARQDQAKSLQRLRWNEMSRWVEDGDAPRALAYLASVIRAQPDSWQASMYAMSIVDQGSFPVLAGPEIRSPVPTVCPARLGDDGTWLVTAGSDRIIREWEVASGREVAQQTVGAPIEAVAAGLRRGEMAVALSDGSLRYRSSRGG